METLFITARTLGVSLGIGFLLGVLWSLSLLDNKTIIAGVSSGVILLIASTVPRHIVRTKISKVVLMVLCLLALCGTATLILNNFVPFEKTDWVAVVMKALAAFALAVMTLEFYSLNVESPRNTG